MSIDDRIIAYFAAHPEMVPLVVWPLVTAALSFVHDQIEARWPRAASLLRKAGFNLAGIIRASWPARLPAPPPLPGEEP